MSKEPVYPFPKIKTATLEDFLASQPDGANLKIIHTTENGYKITSLLVKETNEMYMFAPGARSEKK